MMRVSLILFTILGSLSCRVRDQVKILPLHPYVKTEYTDLGAKTYYYFVVKNFDFKNPHSYDTLYSYASTLKLSESAQKDMSLVLFFTYSVQSNENFRENGSDLIDWHSDDLLFIVAWQKGQPTFKQRFRKGRLIDSTQIEVKIESVDLPQKR